MKKLFSLFFISAFFISSCNLPQRAPQISNDEINTMVAQTRAAMDVVKETPQPTPTITTLTPRATPSATQTPTGSAASLTISSDTNCRNGPGQSYEIVLVLRPGDTAEIIGRYANNTYYVINRPDGQGICWMWSEFATPQGGYASKPEMTPPPTSTASLPKEPRNLTYDFSCSFNASGGIDVTITLNWVDQSNNEAGFRVYRYDYPITDLSPNSTTYTETITINPGDGVNYGVEAFNATGSSARLKISFSCN